MPSADRPGLRPARRRAAAAPPGGALHDERTRAGRSPTIAPRAVARGRRPTRRCSCGSAPLDGSDAVELEPIVAELARPARRRARPSAPVRARRPRAGTSALVARRTRAGASAAVTTSRAKNCGALQAAYSAKSGLDAEGRGKRGDPDPPARVPAQHPKGDDDQQARHEHDVGVQPQRELDRGQEAGQYVPDRVGHQQSRRGPTSSADSPTARRRSTRGPVRATA